MESNVREKDPEKQTRLHVADGMHLNDSRQLAMVYAIQKGLGAPEEISPATVSFSDARVKECANCTITAITNKNGLLTFTRLDQAWPLTLGPLSALDDQLVALQHFAARPYAYEVVFRPVQAEPEKK